MNNVTMYTAESASRYGPTSGLDRQMVGPAPDRRRNRARTVAPRQFRLTPRFTDGEIRELERAAEAAGLTPTGYLAQTAVAAARAAATPHLDPMRGAIAELVATRTAVNRVGANLNQAVAALHVTGETPAWLQTCVAMCQRTIADIDAAIGDMRQAFGPGVR